MRQCFLLLAILLVCIASSVPARGQLHEAYENWQLESAIASAQLVIVVKATHVSDIRSVEGAKTTTLMREYHFQPIKTIKGIYSRDEMVLSASDLNCAIVRPE